MSTHTTDGSRADVQAKIDAAASGDTVTIPIGKFVWESGVKLIKGIHLKGAGAGRVIGRSTSHVLVGTSLKSFETQAGLSIAEGQTLRIERTGTPHVYGLPTGIRTFMVGTVVSYSGTTLVINASATGGSGTHPLWIISTEATTTIVKAISNGVLFSITEDTSHSVEISGIRQTWGGGTGHVMTWAPTANGKPIIVRDCFFELVSLSPTANTITSTTPRGLINRCSFAGFPTGQMLNGEQCLRVVMDYDSGSWTSPSTMGTNDFNGTSNLYIEDCDFHAIQNSFDLADNSRTVVRRCIFNNAGFGTHGADTAFYGVRHYEFYNNHFIFNGYADGNTMNLNYFGYLRGGTGVFTDNTIDNISSTDYGDKAEFVINVQNLRRNAGPNGCWGFDQPGVQYPAPRQFGMGRVTGAAGNDSVTYRGDPEPCYWWNNTGAFAIAPQDYGWSPPTSCGVSEADMLTKSDVIADYVQKGRDYFTDIAKPGWAPFVYPHPLRSNPAPVPEPEPEPETEPTPTPTPEPPAGEAPVITIWPQSQTVRKKANVTFTVSAIGTPTLRYQWFRQGTSIAGATSPTLTLKSVNPGMNGEYAVAVINDHGSQIASARLVVR